MKLKAKLKPVAAIDFSENKREYGISQAILQPWRTTELRSREKRNDFDDMGFDAW